MAMATASPSDPAQEHHDQQIFRAIHACAWLAAYFEIEPNVREARRRLLANNVTTDESALEAIAWQIKTYRPDLLEPGQSAASESSDTDAPPA